MTTKRIYDITRSVDRDTPVWPGDPPFEVDWTGLISSGAPANVARVIAGMHLGTHADAPYHVVASGARMGQVPLEPFIGGAVLLDLQEGSSVDARWATELLQIYPTPARVLIRTGAWSDSNFPTAFRGIDPEAVHLLAGAGVVLIGTDAPSVDAFDARELLAHDALVERGVAILENLMLDGVRTGEYELIALPLKLMELDGSPVRAILREL